MSRHPLTNRLEICAGYFPGDILFDIGGLPEQVVQVPDFVASTFSLLTRGAPTRPSKELEELMNFEWASLDKSAQYYVADGHPDWSQTIKGSDHGYNPARLFFEGVLADQLQEFSFVQQLIVPEYPLFRELNASPALLEGLDGECVDFYLPQAAIVVEIDGAQHKTSRQEARDRARDLFLSRHGVITLRLTTHHLRERGDAFTKFFEALRQRCEQSVDLRHYQEALIEPPKALHDELTAIIRLQIAVILSIARGQLQLDAAEWTISVKQDFPDTSEQAWVHSAFAELFHWFSVFSTIEGAEYRRPHLKLDREGLLFDLALRARADDKVLYGINIRTSAVQDLPTTSGSSVQRYGVSTLPRSRPSRGRGAIEQKILEGLNSSLFHHNRFLPGQETLIRNALSGESSLGLLPTGGGKSLCFQLPGVIGGRTTVVVVPIKALGRDHVAELDSAGFRGRVANIDGDMLTTDRTTINRRVARGELRFLFVSPERFQTEEFLSALRLLHKGGGIDAFVIDEVHCMSEWGHDFRPAYLALPGAMSAISPDIPILGLTATASVNVLRDIQNELGVQDELVAYEMHRSRTELNFYVKRARSAPSDIKREVEAILKKGDQGSPPPNVQVFSRYANGKDGVVEVAAALTEKKLGLKVGYFSGTTPNGYTPHAALSWLGVATGELPRSYEDYKLLVQTLWKSGDLDLIVTTKSFGMGVNKPDVRYTIHAGMPGSTEAFYQEAGRAGRDREKSFCQLLFVPELDEISDIFQEIERDSSPESIETIRAQAKGNTQGDFRKQLFFINQSNISLETEKQLVMRLHAAVDQAQFGLLELRVSQIGEESWVRSRFQHGLFRLYQMGIISPWLVSDWGMKDGEELGIKSVIVTPLKPTFSEACVAVLRRMRAVSGKAAVTDEILRIENLVEKGGEWEELYHHLLTWVRRTQLMSRLQSTRNLYERCMGFSEEGASQFRDQLEAFFRVDSNAFRLSALRELDIPDAARALLGLLVDENGVRTDTDAIRRLHSQMSRLLEGTRESPGLNLAAACLDILVDETGTQNAEDRLRSALPKSLLQFWSSDGRELLTFLASINEAIGERLGAWLLKDQPSRDELLEIYKKLPVKPVGEQLFHEIANELNLAI